MGTSDLRPREHLLAGGACPSWMERRLEGEAASGEGISRESKRHRVWALWGRITAPQCVRVCVCVCVCVCVLGGGCSEGLPGVRSPGRTATVRAQGASRALSLPH